MAWWNDGQNLGRIPQGGTLPLRFLCVNSVGTAVVPDAPPAVQIYRGATKVYSGRLPIADRYRQTGLFSLQLPLGTAFTAGRYGAIVHYQVSGVSFAQPLIFEVLPIGSTDGSVVSLYPYVRPQAVYLAMLTESGQRFFGRNPSV